MRAILIACLLAGCATTAQAPVPYCEMPRPVLGSGESGETYLMFDARNGSMLIELMSGLDKQTCRLRGKES